jgi:hypothetical protein
LSSIEIQFEDSGLKNGEKKEDRQTEKKNSVTIGLITKLQGKKL